jgi:hypothetical protein
LELLKKDSNSLPSERSNELDSQLEAKTKEYDELRSQLKTEERTFAAYLALKGRYDRIMADGVSDDEMPALSTLHTDTGSFVANARKKSEFGQLVLGSELLRAVIDALGKLEERKARELASARQQSLTAVQSIVSEAKDAQSAAEALEKEENELRAKLAALEVRKVESAKKEASEVEKAFDVLQVAREAVKEAVKPPKPVPMPAPVPEPAPATEPTRKPTIDPEPEPEPEPRLSLFNRAPKPPEPPTPVPPPPTIVTLPKDISNAWSATEIGAAWNRLVAPQRPTGNTKRVRLSRDEFAMGLSRDQELAKSLGLNRGARTSNTLFDAIDGGRVRNDSVTFAEFYQFLSRPSKRATTSTIFPDSDTLFGEVLRVYA